MNLSYHFFETESDYIAQIGLGLVRTLSHPLQLPWLQEYIARLLFAISNSIASDSWVKAQAFTGFIEWCLKTQRNKIYPVPPPKPNQNKTCS